MSNKIVPNIYRAVIDDVVSNIKPEFEEFGVSEQVLAELQAKWEAKVIASRVAEFDNHSNNSQHSQPISAAPQTQVQPQPPQPPSHYQTHPMHVLPQMSLPAYVTPHLSYPPSIKSEPMDPRYLLSSAQYTLPPLAGPTIAARPGSFAAHSYNPQQPHGNVTSTANGSTAPRIPQVDGPSSYDSDDDSPSPPSFAPRSSHPSLPQPPSASPSQSQPSADADAINSDLDDSDSEAEDDTEESGVGATDIVFCTYDKVARVKSKWKCVLKDGMIQIDGKDYLFQKCTGEFEWF